MRLGLDSNLDPRCFGSMTRARFIVVGECAVKWVLPRREFDGNVIAPVRTIWIVKTTIVFRPLFVPAACPIRHGIISAWMFADPKDSCHDTPFPRIQLRKPRRCRRCLAATAVESTLKGRSPDDFLTLGLPFSVTASI